MSKLNAIDFVKGANTGMMMWESVGPLLQHLFNSGKLNDVEVTDDDVKAASASLGKDLGDLHQAIADKEKRDAAKG